MLKNRDYVGFLTNISNRLLVDFQMLSCDARYSPKENPSETKQRVNMLVELELVARGPKASPVDSFADVIKVLTHFLSFNQKCMLFF